MPMAPRSIADVTFATVDVSEDLRVATVDFAVSVASNEVGKAREVADADVTFAMVDVSEDMRIAIITVNFTVRCTGMTVLLPQNCPHSVISPAP